MISILAFASLAFTVKDADALTVDIERTFNGLTNDGYIMAESVNWDNAKTAPSGTVYADEEYMLVGCKIESGTYKIYRSYLYFDTSIIPDNATILSANITLTFNAFMSSENRSFSVILQNGMPYRPKDNLESTDYYEIYYSGNGGSLNMEGLSSGTVTIQLNSEGIGWINKEGWTKLCLRADFDINDNEPSESMYVWFASAEAGEEFSPKLIVEYETEGYRTIIHGPYLEDGSVANTKVKVAIELQGQGVNVTVLDGTDGEADTIIYDSELKPLSISWNCSSLYLNTTRIIHLRQDLKFEEFYIYVPDLQNEIADVYTFTVLDLAGIEWGYLETYQTVSGYSRTIERRNLQLSYLASFYLIHGRTYGLRLITNLGVADIGIFTAGATTTSTILITKDMFPEAPLTFQPTCTASRNATTLTATYTDLNETTLWVNWQLLKKQDDSWVTCHQSNVTMTGPSSSIEWSISNQTDYRLNVTAYSTKWGILTWSFNLPAPPPPTQQNPWENLDEILGTVGPIKTRYLIAIFLILAFLGLFSYIDIAVGMFASWCIAATLTYIGWIPIPTIYLGSAMAIIILAAIAKAKKKEAEVEV